MSSVQILTVWLLILVAILVTALAAPRPRRDSALESIPHQQQHTDNDTTEDDSVGETTDVSVSSSTSMEITRMKMSFSTEMSPLSESTEPNTTDTHHQTEPEDITSNEIDDGPDSFEQTKTNAGTVIPSTTTSEPLETAGPTSEATEGSDVSSEDGTSSPPPDSDAELSTPTDSTDSDSEMDHDRTTSGTLIFDLGASASAELRDLVQKTVLDALMDEGLLAAADVAPVFQVEGSGVVFDNDFEGSGEVSDHSGDGEESDSAPYVSIHF